MLKYRFIFDRFDANIIQVFLFSRRETMFNLLDIFLFPTFRDSLFKRLLILIFANLPA